MTTFVIFPTVLEYSVLCGFSPQSFFSLPFQLRKFLMTLSSSLLILPSAMFHLLMSPSKAFFISVTVIIAFLFYSLSEFPFLSLHYPSALACFPFFFQ